MVFQLVSRMIRVPKEGNNKPLWVANSLGGLSIASLLEDLGT